MTTKTKTQTFAEQLREAMKKQGINQRELHEKTGLSQPTISCLLRGRNQPNLHTYRTLCAVLGAKNFS
jgi:transcriptional regulator with XRE-family HTH domain